MLTGCGVTVAWKLGRGAGDSAEALATFNTVPLAEIMCDEVDEQLSKSSSNMAQTRNMLAAAIAEASQELARLRDKSGRETLARERFGNELQRRDQGTALVTQCAAGGIGAALILER